ncbi:RNA-binding S4 domain-containing protein [Gemmobacter serpentinus]|uniref:RNA-binding S4 domain-containing protein n=1 Tax=Gemmobacter serpentinus TaxID=2652247 RepID=UPI00124E67CB|nr:RNA-binding S4 domain-containing protein [Gemmobacter serpentinus]
MAPPRATIRLDKWLWQARFFRSRPMACEMIDEGHLRLNGQRCLKAGHQVGAGDTLTFPQGGRIRLIRVLAPGARRGPASEAQGLYLDLDPQSNLPEDPDAEQDCSGGPETENEILDSPAPARGGILPRSSPLE